MLLKINPDTPNPTKVEKAVDCLQDNGVIITPTDTVYAFACSLKSKKGFKKICEIKEVDPKDAQFSIICKDLGNLSEYAIDIDKPLFKMLKKHLPGPYTFILNASSKVPKLFGRNKKTIGLRVPDNEITKAIVEELGTPLMATSLHHENEILDYMTDPDAIFDKFKKVVDVVVHGGYGDNEPSTVIDCTNNTPEIVRQGKGELIQ